eukprot:COSAG02_NODE_3643_length_6435_cov_3.264994_6_plen_204_part_01
MSTRDPSGDSEPARRQTDRQTDRQRNTQTGRKKDTAVPRQRVILRYIHVRTSPSSVLTVTSSSPEPGVSTTVGIHVSCGWWYHTFAPFSKELILHHPTHPHTHTPLTQPSPQRTPTNHKGGPAAAPEAARRRAPPTAREMVPSIPLLPPSPSLSSPPGGPTPAPSPTAPSPTTPREGHQQHQQQQQQHQQQQQRSPGEFSVGIL